MVKVNKLDLENSVKIKIRLMFDKIYESIKHSNLRKWKIEKDEDINLIKLIEFINFNNVITIQKLQDSEKYFIFFNEDEKRKIEETRVLNLIKKIWMKNYAY